MRPIAALITLISLAFFVPRRSLPQAVPAVSAQEACRCKGWAAKAVRVGAARKEPASRRRSWRRLRVAARSALREGGGDPHLVRQAVGSGAA